MPKLDRRIIRTRGLLRDALMALVLEKGYEAVTVQDITERANLGRATFYLHYKDKEELLVSSLESVFDELVKTLDPPVVAGKLNDGPVFAVFNHAQENSDLYRVLLSGEGSAKIYRRIQDYIAKEAVNRFFPALPKERLFPDDLLANYLAGALLSLTAWWLENGMPYPAEQMTQSFRQLTFLGLGNAMGIDPSNIPIPTEDE
ncbi:MAG: TetR/AcrR family transcriptional regulator [Chloroflexota bacterium]